MSANIINSKHRAMNQKISLKKLSFIQSTILSVPQNVRSILRVLRGLAMTKKSAHILLQALESCINNAKHEAKQKGLIIDKDQSKVLFELGRASCLKRRIFRAKGSSSPIEKHRANVTVKITNVVTPKIINEVSV